MESLSVVVLFEAVSDLTKHRRDSEAILGHRAIGLRHACFSVSPPIHGRLSKST
jgi:hypothetical protein